MSFLGSFPKNSLTFSCTNGIRVCPPTKITSFISDGLSFASFKATSTGLRLFATRFSTKDSSFDLVTFMSKCLGPDASAVM